MLETAADHDAHLRAHLDPASLPDDLATEMGLPMSSRGGSARA